MHILKTNNLRLIRESMRGQVGIKLNGHDTINHLQNIRYLLNIVVMSKFKLKPYSVEEGGLKFFNEAHLINDPNFIIGLSHDFRFGIRPTTKERAILKWYRNVMEILFINGSTGKVRPDIFWFDEKYKNDVPGMFGLLRDACLFSEWPNSEETIEDKVDFFQTKVLGEIGYITKNHLYYDDLVPSSERGLTLGNRGIHLSM